MLVFLLLSVYLCACMRCQFDTSIIYTIPLMIINRGFLWPSLNTTWRAFGQRAGLQLTAGARAMCGDKFPSEWTASRLWHVACSKAFRVEGGGVRRGMGSERERERVGMERARYLYTGRDSPSMKILIGNSWDKLRLITCIHCKYNFFLFLISWFLWW